MKTNLTEKKNETRLRQKEIEIKFKIKKMIDIVWRMISSSVDPPNTSTDEQIISAKHSRNERSLHARRKDKSVPKTFKNNNNLTEMTTNKRTQCSHKDKQDENCLDSEKSSSEECIDDDDEFSCSFNSNHKKSSSSIDTFCPIDYKYLTSKHQQNRISQSSNNQKSALAQCKSNNTISSSNSKCKNISASCLAVKIIQNCQEVNKRWKRWSMPIILSQTSLMLLCTILLIILQSRVEGASTPTKDGICQSKDIRNQPSRLNDLAGCRVIEGFLMITLIDRYNDTDYDNLTFPGLVEITDFLLLYRVQGLKSLAHLFPNLRVIRGNNLVNNYALIVYEMLQLTEIGLKSLTTISRGFVRIEKNPLLCFVDTINWTYIAHGTQLEDHFIDSNKNPNGCLVCPTGKKGDGDGENDRNGNEIECPVSKDDQKKIFCWNQHTCQKICPDNCPAACDDNLRCCDESCLGSCDPTNKKNCTVCRNMSVGPFLNRQCVDNCTNDLFMYEQRRCVTRNECWQIPKPITSSDKVLKNPYIPFNGLCAHTCPKYHAPIGESGRLSCRSCNGECKKECHGSTIDSISGVQNYRGCAVITGTLILQIRQGGQNVIKELEQSLSDIEEIDGALKIMRSYPLISLSFFKKLKLIRGKNIEDSNSNSISNYALYVMDNQNLQYLFDHDVHIERGKIFFHFNSKLCYSQIMEYKNNVTELRNVKNIPIEDVSVTSNGDKVACSLNTLKARPSSVMHIGAIIDVEKMEYEDSRVLLGYVLHFKPAPYKNVSMYDSRDACGGDGWRVEDTTAFDRKAKIVQIVLTNLKPFTQYAYYVKTYTIASEQTGGQTDIQYFHTKPWQPSIVQKMKVVTHGSSRVIVSWDPPKVSNGELTNYIVKASLILDDPELLEQRNYCDEPLRVGEEKLAVPPTQQKPTLNNDPNECACPEDDELDTPPIPREKSENAEAIINFENEIQNIVYVRRTLVVTGEIPRQRRRRTIVDGAGKYSNQTNTIQLDAFEDVFPTSQRTTDKDVVEDFVESRMVDGYYAEFYNNQTNASTHTFTLDQLRHFSTYSISVQACRNFNDTKFNVNSHCSNAVMLNIRTEKLPNADDILSVDSNKVINPTNGTTVMKLTWPEPKNPNGLILTYTVIYKRVDLDNVKPTEQCITRHAHVSNGEGVAMLPLSNGNYSVMVKATSLAGDGHPTPPQFIIIDDPRMNPWAIVFIALGAFAGVVLFIIALWYYFRRKYMGPQSVDLKLIASVNPEYVGMTYEVDEWEIPRDNVIHLRELGQGSFGMVYEGLVKNKDGENVPCAIKTVNENATDRERINFLKEAGVMKAFDTHHVVRLLGVVSITQPTLVVMELMVNGDLKGYLRSHRPDAESSVQPIAQPPSLKRILQMALEIADGMAYLSARKYVHRDLAARNCMVADDLTVKIGDFGMTRDIYETDYYRKGTKGLLPVRWMAPESLKDGVFASSSDVFSYGIVLWEIATGASQPYQGLSNDQVLRYVIDGGVMERPENCPEKLYRLMCRTWQHRPSSRPTFLQIVGQLLEDAAPSFRKLSFYHTQEAQELLQHPQNRGLVIDVTTPLKAEEDDFSLDELAPDAFLMSDVHTSKTDGGASHSPLRRSLEPVRRLTSSFLDIASNKSNKNSPIIATHHPSSINSANTHSILNRNGGQFHRGIEFLRNAFLYKNGSGGGGGGGGFNNAADNESTEYRKLQTTTTKRDQNATDGRNEPQQMTVVGIMEDNVGAIKRQNLSNGFVVSDKTDLD